MVLLLPTDPPLAVVVVKRLAVVIVLLFVTPLGLIGLEIPTNLQTKKNCLSIFPKLKIPANMLLKQARTWHRDARMFIQMNYRDQQPGIFPESNKTTKEQKKGKNYRRNF